MNEELCDKQPCLSKNIILCMKSYIITIIEPCGPLPASRFCEAASVSPALSFPGVKFTKLICNFSSDGPQKSYGVLDYH